MRNNSTDSLSLGEWTDGVVSQNTQVGRRLQSAADFKAAMQTDICFGTRSTRSPVNLAYESKHPHNAVYGNIHEQMLSFV